MKKKIIAIVSVAVLVISVSITATAAQSRVRYAGGYGKGSCGGYSLMCDADGNFLDKETFEANLDKAIEDGLINAEYRDLYIERYDYCINYNEGYMGGGCGGSRGCR